MPNTISGDLDLSQLPPYEKRLFVPANASLTNKDEVLALYEKLLQQSISSSQELESWLQDRSELDAAVDQAGSLLYIRMTSQTDDLNRAQGYKDFVENVVPAVKPLVDQLNQKYLKIRQNFSLDQKRYEIYDRRLHSDVELFRAKNVPLQTHADLLSQEYQTIAGAMTVHFNGEELTLPQMAKFLLEPNRQLREEAWRLISQRRLQDKDRLEEIFDRMLTLRHEIALNAGYNNFCDYQFRAYHRFDYTPNECKQYHETIQRLVVPIVEGILRKRKTQMNLRELRPWDLAVDPLGLSPLKPFREVQELISGVGEIFFRLDKRWGEQFQEMARCGLLDLASRKGKAPGGYQSTLAEARKPFIFMNAVGIDQDVNTLLHEGGHAFHSLAAASQFLYPYRHAPMEFCEVASMTMELLGGEHLDIFYNREDAQRSRLSHLEDIVEILVWVAIVDSFQFWIYEHPKHSHPERTNAWLTIHERFSPQMVDWNGLKDIRAYLWHRQLHIFEVPFYYIEYGIAQLGALSLWLHFKKNPDEALKSYQKALALGGSRRLPEIFQAAGIKFDFSQNTIAPLTQELQL